jgi:hypothetical protein
VIGPQLAELMKEHLHALWPSSVERGTKVRGWDLVMVDADIYGAATRAASLNPRERRDMRQAAEMLDGILGCVPVDARPYFERLCQIAALATDP